MQSSKKGLPETGPGSLSGDNIEEWTALKKGAKGEKINVIRFTAESSVAKKGINGYIIASYNLSYTKQKCSFSC